MIIGSGSFMSKRILSLAVAVLLVGGYASIVDGAIDTETIQRPWPKEQAREFEVGRYEVRWRQKVDKQQGLFAGVRFTVPRNRQLVWKLSNDYSDVGHMTPGVEAVRYIKEGPNRQIIEVDMKVLWKVFTLRFEMEQEPPNAVRFRWADERFGEYLGVAVFEEVAGTGKDAAPATRVDLSTRFLPVHPVPMHLLLGVERIAMLSAAKEFLKACER